MKKLLLLLSIGSIGLVAKAQESARSVILPAQSEEAQHLQLNPQRVKTMQNFKRSANAHQGFANKTTTVNTDRWYNYGDYLDTFYQDNGANGSVSGVIIWQDTLGEALYTSGKAHNRQVSVGNVFMPQAAAFNDVNYYSGEMMIDTTKSYTVDTIRIYGNHNINPAKTSVVDTIVVTTLHGANLFQVYYTGMTARYGSDTLRCADIRYDSVTNTATYTAGSPTSTIKVPITSSMWGDTLGDGTFVLKVPVSIAAAANEKCAVSISFKSGDATFPTVLPGDTIDAFTGVFKYNSFYPFSFFKVIGTSTAFAQYFPGDYNEGVYKTLPNAGNYSNMYVPQWAYYQGTAAAPTPSYLQTIYVDWHVKCTNCQNVGIANDADKAVSGVNAFPNPAGTSVNIKFSLNNVKKAKVSLINTLGQVVASQEAEGSVTFNTAALPAGVYIYSIVANGEQTTGRITVAH